MASSASMEQCTTVSSVSHIHIIFSPPLIARVQGYRWNRHRLTLHRREAQLLCNLRVPDLGRVLERHAAHQLGEVAGARNGAAAAKRLELDVADGVVVRVDTDLELHDIAARGGADETSADISVGLGHGADIARAVVVVEQWKKKLASRPCPDGDANHGRGALIFLVVLPPGAARDCGGCCSADGGSDGRAGAGCEDSAGVGGDGGCDSPKHGGRGV